MAGWQGVYAGRWFLCLVGMYLRRTQRRTKDGGAVGYLQLAHNVWDRESRQSRVRVIHSFGREDELDRDAIVRLIGSLQRVLGPGEALEAAADAELRFVESRPMGGALMLTGCGAGWGSTP